MISSPFGKVIKEAPITRNQQREDKSDTLSKYNIYCAIFIEMPNRTDMGGFGFFDLEMANK